MFLPFSPFEGSTSSTRRAGSTLTAEKLEQAQRDLENAVSRERRLRAVAAARTGIKAIDQDFDSRSWRILFTDGYRVTLTHEMLLAAGIAPVIRANETHIPIYDLAASLRAYEEQQARKPKSSDAVVAHEFVRHLSAPEGK